MTTPVSPPMVLSPAASLVEELPTHVQPLEALQRLAHLPHAVCLDSAAPHATLGRYSFVSADPFDWLQSRGPADGDPFALLAERLRRWRCEPLPDLPPFQGGAAGLF